MSDLRRQLNTLRRTNERLNQELANLKALKGEIDPAYSSALRDLADIAAHAIRRPEDLGATLRSAQPNSTPPNYDPRAADILQAERKDQRRRAAELRSKFLHLVDGAHAGEAPIYKES